MFMLLLRCLRNRRAHKKMIMMTVLWFLGLAEFASGWWVCLPSLVFGFRSRFATIPWESLQFRHSLKSHKLWHFRTVKSAAMDNEPSNTGMTPPSISPTCGNYDGVHQFYRMNGISRFMIPEGRWRPNSVSQNMSMWGIGLQAYRREGFPESYIVEVIDVPPVIRLHDPDVHVGAIEEARAALVARAIPAHISADHDALLPWTPTPAPPPRHRQWAPHCPHPPLKWCTIASTE